MKNNLWQHCSSHKVPETQNPNIAIVRYQQCWGKLFLKVMHDYSIVLLYKKLTNYITQLPTQLPQHYQLLVTFYVKQCYGTFALLFCNNSRYFPNTGYPANSSTLTSTQNSQHIQAFGCIKDCFISDTFIQFLLVIWPSEALYKATYVCIHDYA